MAVYHNAIEGGMTAIKVIIQPVISFE